MRTYYHFDILTLHFHSLVFVDLIEKAKVSLNFYKKIFSILYLTNNYLQ